MVKQQICVISIVKASSVNQTTAVVFVADSDYGKTADLFNKFSHETKTTTVVMLQTLIMVKQQICV